MKFFRVFFAITALLLFNACSDSENDEEPTGDSASLIGEWQRISTTDQDGNVSDDTSTCNITEITTASFIVTDYVDANCTQEFSSGSLPYTRVDDFIYFGEVSQDIKVEITQLSSSTLKLKGEYSDEGETYYDIVTYNRK